jgi:hypothetical protein
MAHEAGKGYYTFDLVGPKPVPAAGGEFSLVAVKKTPDNPTIMLIDSLRAHGFAIKLKPLWGNPESDMIHVTGEDAANSFARIYSDPMMVAIRGLYDPILHRQPHGSVSEGPKAHAAQIKDSLLESAAEEDLLVNSAFGDESPWRINDQTNRNQILAQETRHKVAAIEHRVWARKFALIEQNGLSAVGIKEMVEMLVSSYLGAQYKPQV